MTAWRLLACRGSYADFSISVSPAVEKAVRRGEAPPTVLLNVFDSDSITIGVNEDPEQALDLEFCAARGIVFRRRPNSGGPVYAGAGSAFLVFVLPTADPRVPRTTAEAFPRVLTALAGLFADRYGFPARYRPLNDVEVEGRKLVPSSLKIEGGAMTFRIVVNVTPIDTELAGRAMPMPPEKVRDKALKDLGARFTCLEREAGREIGAAELETLAAGAAERAFGETGLVPSGLTARERAYAEAFRAEFATDDWLFAKSESRRFGGLPGPGDAIGRGRWKAPGGLIRAALVTGGGTVRAAIVNGDWHPRPIEAASWLEDALASARAEPAALRARVAAHLARPDVEHAGVGLDDLTAALDRALADRRPAGGPP